MRRFILMNACVPAVALVIMGAAASAKTTPAPRPVLATVDQLDAEARVIKVLKDPAVIAATQALRQNLLADPAATTSEGRALLDHAVTLLSYSLALREVASDTAHPVVLWDNEDTPHRWYGHDIPGAGVSGDNPDNIYRGSAIDGSGRYEITGHVAARNGPTQFSIEATVGEPGKPGLTTLDKHHADMGSQLGLLRDKDIVVDASGNFRISLDDTPANGRPNHIQLKPGPVSIIYRNSLADWKQIPTEFAIRRLDAQPVPHIDDAELVRRIAADLPGWGAFWMKFKSGWLGRPPANTLNGPLARDGGWGFLAGGTYALADDEAIVATVTNGDARYTGVQVFDPWFLAADSRKYFTSRNNSQSTPNADGSVTYVIAPRDPGVANWIDTAGLHAGGVLFRWQQTADAASPKILDYRAVKIADLRANLPKDIAWTSPSQRAADLAVRAKDYERRLTNR